MHSSITPIQSSFKFGTATTLFLKSIGDNLVDRADFFWQLGKMVTPAPRTVTNNGEETTVQDDPVFVGDEQAIGNASLSGSAYSSWSGSNAEVPALVVSQIGVTLVK